MPTAATGVRAVEGAEFWAAAAGARPSACSQLKSPGGSFTGTAGCSLGGVAVSLSEDSAAEVEADEPSWYCPLRSTLDLTLGSYLNSSLSRSSLKYSWSLTGRARLAPRSLTMGSRSVTCDADSAMLAATNAGESQPVQKVVTAFESRASPLLLASSRL